MSRLRTRRRHHRHSALHDRLELELCERRIENAGHSEGYSSGSRRLGEFWIVVTFLSSPSQFSIIFLPSPHSREARHFISPFLLFVLRHYVVDKHLIPHLTGLCRSLLPLCSRIDSSCNACTYSSLYQFNGFTSGLPSDHPCKTYTNPFLRAEANGQTTQHSVQSKTSRRIHWDDTEPTH